MRRRSPPSNEFFLPHEVFKLGLKQGPLLVYLYLICRKSVECSADKLSCPVIGKAVGMCERTVRTHLRTLVNAGFIEMKHHNKRFPCSLCPIGSKVHEHRRTWTSAKQVWLTGESFGTLFPLPIEVFQLGFTSGELLVYLYLQYRKGVRSGQCWSSYATIGKAVNMSRKTVQKHVWSLVDKGLIETEDTMIRRKNSRSYNGSLRYTIIPIRQVLKMRENELLEQLKMEDAQRKLDWRNQKRDRRRSAL